MTQSEVHSAPVTQTTSVANAVNITYDKLFELERAEKNSPDLFKIPVTFYADLRAYLKFKQDSITRHQSSKDIFASEHVKTAFDQLEKSKKLANSIYCMRERKITQIARNKVQTNANVADMTGLLAEEKALFSQLVSLFSAQRAALIEVMSGQGAPAAVSADGSVAPVSVPEAAVPQPQIAAPVADKSYEVIEEITEFFGPDMQHYGPFARGDKVSFSDQIARILLKKNLVKQI